MNELRRVTGDFAPIETSPRVFVAYTHYRMMFSNSINVTYPTLQINRFTVPYSGVKL